MDVGGAALTPIGDRDLFIARFDAATGAKVWVKQFGSLGSIIRAECLAAAPNGDIAAAGSIFGGVDFGGGAVGAFGFYSARLDSSGGHVWSKVYSSMTTANATSLAINGTSDHLALVGTASSSMDLGGGALPHVGGQDVFLAIVGANGGHLSSHQHGSMVAEDVFAVATQGNLVSMGGSYREPIDFGGEPLKTNTSTYGKTFSSRPSMPRRALTTQVRGMEKTPTSLRGNPTTWRTLPMKVW